MNNNQKKYWASSKVTRPLLACPDAMERVQTETMARGGARPRTGLKVKPEDKRQQMSFMVHPTTKDKINLLADKWDISLGMVVDKAIKFLPTDTKKEEGNH